MRTPKDQLHDLIDHLENGLAQNGPMLGRSEAVDVLQRLIDLTMAQVDQLQKRLVSLWDYPGTRGDLANKKTAPQGSGAPELFGISSGSFMTVSVSRH